MMTLQDLYKRLDWTAVDAGHTEWESSHDEAIRIDRDALRQHRLERLHYAIAALNGTEDMRHWWMLPTVIRQQVADNYSQMGLIDAAK